MAIPEGNGRAAGDGGKPSLIAGAPSAVGGGTPARAAMRVLDGIGDDGGAGRRPGRPRARWPMAVALGVLAIGALWWWAGVGGEDATAPPSAMATPASTAPATSLASASASAGSESPPSVARIETAPPVARVAVPEPAASAVVASGAGSAAAERTTTATAARRPAATLATAHEPARAKPGETAARAAAHETDRAHARTAATPATPRPTGSTVAAGDPDVALLSAMLARLSNENGAASPATIAQMVEQCEATPLRGAIDSFECRRRICSGYWGKADACPIALAPARAR